jgi:hypothetical protein
VTEVSVSTWRGKQKPRPEARTLYRIGASSLGCRVDENGFVVILLEARLHSWDMVWIPDSLECLLTTGLLEPNGSPRWAIRGHEFKQNAAAHLLRNVSSCSIDCAQIADGWTVSVVEDPVCWEAFVSSSRYTASVSRRGLHAFLHGCCRVRRKISNNDAA